MRLQHGHNAWSWYLILLLLFPAPSRAQRSAPDLANASLEELMSIEVTSVSKKEQKLSEVAAAIGVITQEDIRRSGATSLPEVLRLVPGLQIARINNSEWAVSARGFNSRWSNMLLILMDGRIVYDPSFSGVYWDMQDTVLEDIERIEVIRGPGATMWGANAVNGVINIITRQARDTQGGLLTTGGGSEERDFGVARYGGKLGSKAYYRAYSKYFQRRLTHDPGDRWAALRGGFRTDWEASARDSFTFQGDLYESEVTDRATVLGQYEVSHEVHPSGANVLGRWKRLISDNSDMALQVYYDRVRRRDPLVGEKSDTIALDFQHRWAPAPRHELLWGMGSNFVKSQFDNRGYITFQPPSRADALFSGFLQDEILLLPGRVHLTLGSKVEHNNYSGFDLQPSARIAWAPQAAHTVWASVSRAVRTPARSDHDMRINFAQLAGPGGLPTYAVLLGNRKVRPEEVLACELGARLQPQRRISLDFAAFYNRYHRLRTREPGAFFVESTPPPVHGVLPLTFDNKMKGETYGAEVQANWRPVQRWRLALAYTWLRMQLHSDPTSADRLTPLREGENPRHQLQFRSYLDLPARLSFDAAVYHVDRLLAQQVPSYTRVDGRLGWRMSGGLEVSLQLQDVSNAHRVEFNSILDHSGFESEVFGRAIWAKISWRFPGFPK